MLLVGELGAGAGEEDAQVVPRLLARHGRLADLLVQRLELALAEDVHAMLLTAGEDEAGREFIPEFGRQDDAPLFVEHHPPLGQIELERIALLPRGEQRAPAGPQRLQRLLDQVFRHRPFDFGHRAGRGADLDPLLRRSVDRSLRILVCNVCCDANLRSRETPTLERSVLGDL